MILDLDHARAHRGASPPLLSRHRLTPSRSARLHRATGGARSSAVALLLTATSRRVRRAVRLNSRYALVIAPATAGGRSPFTNAVRIVCPTSLSDWRPCLYSCSAAAILFWTVSEAGTDRRQKAAAMRACVPMSGSQSEGGADRGATRVDSLRAEAPTAGNETRAGPACLGARSPSRGPALPPGPAAPRRGARPRRPHLRRVRAGLPRPPLRRPVRDGLRLGALQRGPPVLRARPRGRAESSRGRASR